MIKKVSPFTALKIKDFRYFWTGSFISQMGTQMELVAVAWQLYSLTHSPASLGFIGVANIIPILLFSLVGGVTADKQDRRNVMLVCQAILAVLSFILFAQTHFQMITPFVIYLILALESTATSFNMPARQAVIPNLVPRNIFVNAVSIMTLQRQSAIIIGPAIAGFVIAIFGVQAIYLFNSVSFLAFIIMLLLIKIPKVEKKKDIAFGLTSIKDGISFVKDSPILLSTMVLDFLATFLGTAQILMPVFAKDVLGVGVQGLGLLYSAPAIGGVAAGLYFAHKHQIKNQGKVIIFSILFYGAAIIGFGLSKIFYLSLFFLVLMGMGDMISTIVRNTIRQLMTPDYLRGRMVSINWIFVQGGPQLGDAEAGFLASLIGAPLTTVIGGAGTILITLLVSKFIPSLKKYRGEEVSL